MRRGLLAGAAALTLGGLAPASATAQHYCGHLQVHGGAAEFHASGISCPAAQRVLRTAIRQGYSPRTWHCRKGTAAVKLTCTRGTTYAVLYQPASIYGE